VKTVTSVEAQNHFGELLDNAQREPISITRRGRPVAFIVSQHDMAELADARNKRSQAVADFEAYFAGVDARLSAEAKALTEADVKRLVKGA
jgi:prevent-host-death family protein